VTQLDQAGAADAPERASWRPMIALFLAQVLMSFNVAALPVSIGGMVEDFDVPPTDVSTAIVMYGLFVAALVMVGAKLGQRVGWVRIFRIVIGLFAVAELMMVVAPTSVGSSPPRPWPGRRRRSSCPRSSR
jgi:MFS family permease